MEMVVRGRHRYGDGAISILLWTAAVLALVGYIADKLDRRGLKSDRGHGATRASRMRPSYGRRARARRAADLHTYKLSRQPQLQAMPGNEHCRETACPASDP